MRKKYTGTYRFKRIHRQHQPGDKVPDSFDDGTVGTMLAGQTIEEVVDEGKMKKEKGKTEEDRSEEKSIDAPAADKSMSTPRGSGRRARVVNK